MRELFLAEEEMNIRMIIIDKEERMIEDMIMIEKIIYLKKEIELF